MSQVIEEFVAYNFLPSRERQILESLGLSWFWAYKVRSIKVAHRLIRDKPARAMLLGMTGGLVPDLPGVNVGGPISDNALNVFAEGRHKFSLGPGMLFGSPGLHPILGGALEKRGRRRPFLHAEFNGVRENCSQADQTMIKVLDSSHFLGGLDSCLAILLTTRS